MSLVYSTDVGRIKKDKPEEQRPKGDGIARIQREDKKVVKVKVSALYLGLI